ncbi:ribonuclease H-like protein [Fomitiporia mediterranea MF3/22]|uniref:ribonuclease H-like protein n=1 Tax=Fomitiporia mediterranea (strain MF3/22) TaxID=694068 RepID=UPI00044091A4|nr:ribonuclease H-like protein [Fomitiporia mediterranea MF3/22]EJD04292.1 ribonuclease H-like protein [Fomitiporia mediterranea MF3/22]
MSRPSTSVVSDALDEPGIPFYSAISLKNSQPADIPVYSFLDSKNAPEVIYIRDHEQANRELARVFYSSSHSESARIAGMDVEWRTAAGLPDRPIALVQLATRKTILLLQICAMEAFPKMLIDILDDETILKAGVGILGECTWQSSFHLSELIFRDSGDAQRLYRDHAVTVRSCVELSYLARCVDHDRWPGDLTNHIGIARLVYVYKGLLLSKGRMKMTNWEEQLTEEQKLYAANDAHAGMAICTSLLRRAHHLDRTLFMFNVISANAVRADGRLWQAYDIHRMPSPALRTSLIERLHAHSTSGAHSTQGTMRRRVKPFPTASEWQAFLRALSGRDKDLNTNGE